ncbi:MAG: TIGR01212 family radical SAM protein [Clostridia bacterium]|jgi:radical SAM protein (TIGR01212 family)|nr:TIGR01212 family radical SAM protein [Clostridia bacterium]
MYNKYSDYLKEKYGEKVYKLPINLPLTCPNRDGCLGEGGCTFCAEEGAGHESLENTKSVKEQLLENKDYISSRYGAKKFIAYFQNYSNTYVELESFKKYIKEAMIEDVVEIAISTRPDCIREDYLEFLSELDINVSFELGLQTVNYKTLKKVNRGHTLAEFIDAVNMIKKYNFEIAVHIITNLPWDEDEDLIEASKIMSALKVDQVKLHSLYIAEGTEMARGYKAGEFEIISKDEFVERTILFLEYLNPKITLQRLLGRVPEERSVFANWDMSWWKIKDEIEEKMEKENRHQGRLFNYLNGKCLK